MKFVLLVITVLYFRAQADSGGSVDDCPNKYVKYFGYQQSLEIGPNIELINATIVKHIAECQSLCCHQRNCNAIDYVEVIDEWREQKIRSCYMISCDNAELCQSSVLWNSNSDLLHIVAVWDSTEEDYYNYEGTSTSAAVETSKPKEKEEDSWLKYFLAEKTDPQAASSTTSDTLSWNYKTSTASSTISSTSSKDYYDWLNSFIQEKTTSEPPAPPIMLETTSDKSSDWLKDIFWNIGTTSSKLNEIVVSTTVNDTDGNGHEDLKVETYQDWFQAYSNQENNGSSKSSLGPTKSLNIEEMLGLGTTETVYEEKQSSSGEFLNIFTDNEANSTVAEETESYSDSNTKFTSAEEKTQLEVPVKFSLIVISPEIIGDFGSSSESEKTSSTSDDKDYEEWIRKYFKGEKIDSNEEFENRFVSEIDSIFNDNEPFWTKFLQPNADVSSKPKNVKYYVNEPPQRAPYWKENYYKSHVEDPTEQPYLMLGQKLRKNRVLWHYSMFLAAAAAILVLISIMCTARYLLKPKIPHINLQRTFYKYPQDVNLLLEDGRKGETI